jgi:hypothetical protein
LLLLVLFLMMSCPSFLYVGRLQEPRKRSYCNRFAAFTGKFASGTRLRLVSHATAVCRIVCTSHISWRGGQRRLLWLLQEETAKYGIHDVRMIMMTARDGTTTEPSQAPTDPRSGHFNSYMRLHLFINMLRKVLVRVLVNQSPLLTCSNAQITRNASTS